jgi:hypothetical protein
LQVSDWPPAMRHHVLVASFELMLHIIDMLSAVIPGATDVRYLRLNGVGDCDERNTLHVIANCLCVHEHVCMNMCA